MINVVKGLKRLYGLDGGENVLNFQMGQVRFEVKDGYLHFKSITKKFRVRLSDIETVSVDKKGMTKDTLKIIGKGTTLASIDLYRQWTEKAQDFVLIAIENQNRTN